MPSQHVHTDVSLTLPQFFPLNKGAYFVGFPEDLIDDML